ncbi:MAG: hypothetical protein P8N76_02150 [Pirellulaceae bacterium]|nr:hypothetical protein [Pirellulaceae bacterium]
MSKIQSALLLIGVKMRGMRAMRVAFLSAPYSVADCETKREAAGWSGGGDPLAKSRETAYSESLKFLYFESVLTLFD